MKISFAIFALLGYTSAITIHQLTSEDPKPDAAAAAEEKPSAAEEAKAAADKEGAPEAKKAPPATDGPE